MNRLYAAKFRVFLGLVSFDAPGKTSRLPNQARDDSRIGGPISSIHHHATVLVRGLATEVVLLI
jgi:hypothetical protein